MSNALTHEGFLNEHYQHPHFLPPLWRIIFQEAMRGHHIIFPRSIPSEAVLSRPKEISDDMVEFCVHLFAAPDLRSIKSMIGVLPKGEQKQLFCIYLQQMESIKEQNKSSMN